jgi:hypothetical protein
LPDARLLQAMTYTLLEAGRRRQPADDRHAGRGALDVAIYAGGITWVDRTTTSAGEALRPLTQDFRACRSASR